MAQLKKKKIKAHERIQLRQGNNEIPMGVHGETKKN